MNKILSLGLLSLTMGLTNTASAVEEGDRVRGSNGNVYKVSHIEKVAVEIEDEDEDEGFQAVISVRGGFDYAKVGGKTVHTDLPGFNNNAYIPTEKWHSAGFWGIFLGTEFTPAEFVDLDVPLYELIRWQTGISYYDGSRFRVDGQVEEFGYPPPDLEYTYKVHNQRLMWENKFLGELNDYFDLYFLAGLGVAINKATEYKEEALNPLFLPNTPGEAFGNKTTHSLTYSFGVGLELTLIEDLRLGVGYQYSDLGKVELADAPGQSNGHFSFDSTPTHEVVLNLTYLFF